jgi:hypothetical protein
MITIVNVGKNQEILVAHFNSGLLEHPLKLSAS